jgi:hypothetical protein
MNCAVKRSGFLLGRSVTLVVKSDLGSVGPGQEGRIILTKMILVFVVLFPQHYY